VAAEVVVVQLVDRTDGAGEEAASQRGVGHEADAELTHHRQDLCLRLARPQRVLRLQRGHRVDGMRPPDGGRRSLGQPVVPDLALGDELGERADGLLDGRARVHPVLVVQVDVVGVEPPQGALDGQPHVLRAAVQAAGAVAAVPDRAELRRDHHLVPATGERASEQFLVEVRPVHLRGVEQGDAEVDRAVDRRYRTGLVGTGAGVEGRHAHAAEADATDLEAVAQRCFPHVILPTR